jgi:hypothetical protein
MLTLSGSSGPPLALMVFLASLRRLSLRQAALLSAATIHSHCIWEQVGIIRCWRPSSEDLKLAYR